MDAGFVNVASQSVPERGMPRLVLWPGLGADPRLFHRLRRALPDVCLVTPAWRDPGTHRTLASYAAECLARGEVRPGDIVGGVSLGGMLAQEIAAAIPVAGCVLISTARSGRDVAPISRAMAGAHRIVHARSALRLAQLSGVIAGLRCAFLDLARSSDQRLAYEMLSSLSDRFWRFAVPAALAWPGVGDLEVPTLRLHGRRDRLFRFAGAQPALGLVGGGHLCVLSHAEEIAAAIRAFLVRIPVSSPSDHALSGTLPCQ